MYMRKINSKIKHDRLRWGYLSREDFILGPNRTGIIQGSPTVDTQRQILTSSMGIDSNSVPLEMVSDKESEIDNDWVVFKCKYCYVWMYSYNKDDGSFALLLNNQIKPSYSGLSRH